MSSDEKSTPIVGEISEENLFLVYLYRMLVLPTPLSPTTIIFNK